MDLLIRSYIDPFDYSREKNKYGYYINKWKYNPLSFVTGEKINIPFFLQYKKNEKKCILLNIDVPEDILIRTSYKKNWYIYSIELQLNYVLKNEKLLSYITNTLYQFRTKYCYSRDIYGGDYIADLDDSKLWMYIENIIARLEERDYLRRPREEYVIYYHEEF